MPTTTPVEFAHELRTIAALTMRLGKVERATRHPDGVTRETDTTHSVMLALSVTRLAFMDGLPPAPAVLLFALLHDLVEAYAGDTMTLRSLSEDNQAAKDAAEAEALERIRHELPWAASVIARYEAQATPEARLVKLADKIMPKLTHAANGYVVLVENEMTVQELEDRLAGQLEIYGDPEHLPFTTALFERTSIDLVDGYRKHLEKNP